MVPVKNQRQYGSHGVFSITESLEDAWFIAIGSLSLVSEQHLVDCDMVRSAYKAGLMDNGFDSVEKNAMYSEASRIHTATKDAARFQVAAWDRPGRCRGRQESILLRASVSMTARFQVSSLITLTACLLLARISHQFVVDVFPFSFWSRLW